MSVPPTRSPGPPLAWHCHLHRDDSTYPLNFHHERRCNRCAPVERLSDLHHHQVKQVLFMLLEGLYQLHCDGVDCGEIEHRVSQALASREE